MEPSLIHHDTWLTISITILCISMYPIEWKNKLSAGECF